MTQARVPSPRRRPDSRWRPALLLLSAAALFVPLAASAAGGLDPTFGSGGKVLTDFGQSDVIEDLALQSDGKIVAVGITQSPTTFATQFALARYARNGSLDAGFGSGGKVTTSFGGNESRGFAVAVQADGKIVAAGLWSAGVSSGGPTGTDIALARYNADGSLDTSFGAGGRVLTDFNLTHDNSLDLAIQRDGKLVVVGYTRPFGPVTANPSDFALARYHPDGSLDASFSGDGKVTTDFAASSEDRGVGIALAPDGKIVAAGYRLIRPAATTEIEVARYNTDGSLDVSFDGDGKVLTANGRANDVVVQPDGKIVIAGNVGQNLAVVRYSLDGNLDSSFGAGGVGSASFGSKGSAAEAVARQRDGRIVTAGLVTPDPSSTDNDFAFAIARFENSGRLDKSFYGGQISTDFGTTTWDEAQGLVFQPDGRIIAGGSSALPTSGLAVRDFALARYLAPVPSCRVPNVRRKTLAAAKKRIRVAHCSVGRVRYARSKTKKGRVIKQTPRPGKTLPNRSKVNLVVSRGPTRA